MISLTKEELEQLNDLRREISELEAAIDKIKQQKTECVIDKVRASGSEFPYIDGFKKISGTNMAAVRKRRERIQRKENILDERRQKAEAEEIRIMEYINSVQDSRVRRIMQYRYVQGFSWERIAGIMNYDKSYIQRLISKFLDNK
jgi:DNA-directed RNA polymerase specialized sigma subunit